MGKVILQCREPSCKKVFYSYSGRQGHEDSLHPDSPYRMYLCITFSECEGRPLLWSINGFRAHLRETHHLSKDEITKITIAAEAQAAERRENLPLLSEEPVESKPKLEPILASTNEDDQEDDRIPQVIDLYAQGLTWREASERLGITTNIGTTYYRAATWALRQYIANKQCPQITMDPVVAIKTLLDDYEQMKLKAEMGNEAYTAVNVLQQERDDLQHELSVLQERFDQIRNLFSGE